MWSVLSFSLAIAALGVAIVTAVAVHRLRAMFQAFETSERMTPTKFAQLVEVNEALQRAEELLVKVNRREVARAKRRDDAGQFVPSGPESLKDHLRRQAGLRAGKPAPHA